MTRKDFELIAGVLNCQHPRWTTNIDAKHTWELIVEAFANTLKTSNPNFDKGRFIEACKK